MKEKNRIARLNVCREASRTRDSWCFAGALFIMLFTNDEMNAQNCCGLVKKGKLNDGKLNKIQEYVYKYYLDTPEQLCRT